MMRHDGGPDDGVPAQYDGSRHGRRTETPPNRRAGRTVPRIAAPRPARGRPWMRHLDGRVEEEGGRGLPPAGLYLPGFTCRTFVRTRPALSRQHPSTAISPPNTARSGSASGPAVGTGSRTGSHWNLHDTNTTGTQDACLPPTFETTAHEYKPYARLRGRGPHRGRLAPAEPDGSFTRAFPGPSPRADIGAPQLTGVPECTARFPLRRGPACQPPRVPRCRSLAERKRTGSDVRFASSRRAAGLFAYAQRNCR